MKNVYTCPHCQAVLNPSVKVVLAVSYRKKRGLLLLSPQPGNYKIICEPDLAATMKAGATVTLACPACGADLTSPVNAKLAELHLVGGGQRPRRVQFSRVYGTHATFIIDGDEVTSYGEDVQEFDRVNFFGV